MWNIFFQANTTVTYGVSGSPAQFTCSSLSIVVEDTAHAVTCALVGGLGSAVYFQLKTRSGDYTLVSNVGADALSFPAPTFVDGTIKLYNASASADMTTHSGLFSLIDPVSSPSARLALGAYTEGEFLVMAVTNMVTVSSFDAVTLAANAALLKLKYGDSVSNLLYECFDPALWVAQNGGDTLELLRCRSSPGADGPYNFQATSNGQVTATLSGDSYQYPVAPKISSVTPVTDGQTPTCTSVNATAVTGCTTLGGEKISIYIKDVATDPTLVFVFVSGNDCVISSIQRPTSGTADEMAKDATVICTLPPGVGVNQPVTVSSSALWSQAALLVSYAAPIITTIAGCPAGTTTSVTECVRAGGNTITLTGKYFGASDAMVLVGGVSCTAVTHDTTSPQTKVTCTAPQGTNLDLNVKLIQNMGLVSSDDIRYSYLPCPAGQYADSASPACLDCAGGSYTDVKGTAACSTCIPGTYATGPAWTICDVCSPGNFAASGSSACTACTAGTYADQAQSAQCTECVAGKFSATNAAASCDECLPGTAQPDSSKTECVDCLAGEYQSDYGQATCTPCFAGYFNENTKQKECTPCVAGEYAATTHLETCSPCSMGSYQVRSLSYLSRSQIMFAFV